MLRRRTCSAAKSNDASNPAAIQLAPGFSFLLMTPGSMTACLCPLHVDRECFSTVAGHTIYIPIIFLIINRKTTRKGGAPPAVSVRIHRRELGDQVTGGSIQRIADTGCCL
jgi:hypothetical protein